MAPCSSILSSSSPTQLFTLNLHPKPILLMANQISGGGAATSGANSNPDVRIDVIWSEPLLPNTELSEALDSFRANSHGMSDFCTAMKGRLKGHRSLIGRSENIMAILTACIFFLQQEKKELKRVRKQQRQMQGKFQSADNVIKAKLDRAKYLKYACVVLYVIVAAISIAAGTLAGASEAMAAASAASATASSAHKKNVMEVAALAAAAAFLYGQFGKLIDSLLEKLVSALKRERKISKAMIKFGKFTFKDLEDIDELLDCELKSETEYMQEMDSDEVAVRNKLTEVNERFQELQRRAKHCSLDASDARKYVLNSIMRNMDSGE